MHSPGAEKGKRRVMNSSVPDDLFPPPRPTLIVCAQCGKPLQIERVIREGETLYAPCPDCGRAGIVRQGDQWKPGEMRSKKPARLLYWERGA